MTAAQQLGPVISGSVRTGAGRRTSRVVNPFNEEVLGDLHWADENDIADALDCAAAGFEKWRTVPPWERGVILRRAADALRAEADPLAALITREQGKIAAEARAEVLAAAEVFDWCSEEGKRSYGRAIASRSAGRSQTVLREPVGPVAAFAPWNFPLVLPVRKIAAALAAGCSVILKPAEETPSAAIAVARICVAAGVPPEALSVVFGDPPEISRRLIGAPAIRMASITGSVEAGRAVATLCGQHIKRCVLELGGHTAAGVFADADVDAAARKLAAAKFRNAGQVCVSPSRFYVHEKILDEFVSRVTALAQALKPGDGADPRTTMGPLANSRQLRSVEAAVADAIQKGARLHTGGRRVSNKGCLYEPTVLSGVPADASIMQVEPFGPVMPVVSFKSLDDFVRQANALEYGLAGLVFTNDLRTARQAASRLEAGLVGVNDTAFGLPETPVCGVKASGYGHEGGTEGVAEYMVSKFVNEIAW